MKKQLFKQITSYFLTIAMTLSLVVHIIPSVKVYAKNDETLSYNEIILNQLVKSRNFVINTLTQDNYLRDNPNAVANGLFKEMEEADSRKYHYLEVLDELTNLSSRSGFAILVHYKYLGNQVGDVGARIIQDSYKIYSVTIDHVLGYFPDMVFADLATLTTEQLCEALAIEITVENRAEYDEISDAIRKIGAGIRYVENEIQNYKSPSESQYAAILNHAFTTNYTSSIGNSSSYEQIEMEELESVEKFLNLQFDISIDETDENKITVDLPEIAGNIKDSADFINESIMRYHTDRYVDEIFSNLTKSGESQLSGFSRMVQYDLEHSSLNSGNDSRFAVQSQKALQTLIKDGEYEYLATQQAWRNHIIGYTNAETGEIYNTKYKKQYEKYKKNNSFIESAESIYKVFETGLSIGKKTIENIDYFETLYRNYESMHGFLERANEYIGNDNVHIADAINTILIDMEMVNANNENIMMLSMVDALLDVIIANDKNTDVSNLYTVNKYGSYIKKTISENAIDAMALTIARNKNLNPFATRMALSTAIKRIGGAVSLGVTIGDIVFNVNDIVDKYVELLYISEVIDIFQNMYQDDYSNYLIAKNNGATTEERDELARIVLDDLELLKILICRAESLSFDVDISALNCLGNKVFETIYGTIISDPSYAGQRKAELEAQKQSHIDAIVDTLINPYSTPQITLTKGQWLNIKENDGDILLEIYDEDSEGVPIAVKAEGQYALRGYVSATDATILINGNVYIGTLSLKNSSLKIMGNTELVGLYGLEMTGESRINTVNNAYTPLVEVSYASMSGTSDISAVKFHVTENLSLDKATVSGEIVNFGNYSGTGDCHITSLIIDGELSTQYSGGTLDLYNLNIVNTSPRGIILDNITMNVSSKLENDNTYIVNGNHIHALSTAVFVDPYFHSDITLDNLSITNDMTFGGTVYTAGNITLGGNNFTCGGIFQESGTLDITPKNCIVNGNVINKTSNMLTVSADTSMIVGKDMNLHTAAASFNGTVKLAGDLIVNNNNVVFNCLELNGIRNQYITNTSTSDYTLKAAELVIHDRHTGGVRMKNNITVSDSVQSMGWVTSNGERITLMPGGTVVNGCFNGNLTLDSASLLNNLTINGNLVIKNGLTTNSHTLQVNGNVKHSSGVLTVSGGGNMSVSGTFVGENTGKTFTVADTGRLHIGNIANLYGYNTVTADGMAVFGRDLTVSGTVSGLGTIQIGGDFTASGTLNKPTHVILTSKIGQTINGGTLNFQNLTVHNTSGTGVRFMKTANVYGLADIQANRIVNEDYIIQKAG